MHPSKTAREETSEVPPCLNLLSVLSSRQRRVRGKPGSKSKIEKGLQIRKAYFGKKPGNRDFFVWLYSVLTLNQKHMDFFENILVEIIANFIFSAILILLGWFVYITTRRNRMMDFFNIKKTKRIVIYLSNIIVQRGGSKGYDGVLRNYYGSTVVLQEQVAANKFRETMNYLAPSLSEGSSVLGKILLSDIKISIVASPNEIGEIDSDATIISFGSPGYNIVSKFIEEHPKTICKFIRNNSSIAAPSLKIEDEEHIGFIQKIYDPQKGKSLFYAAGVAELGTIGAARYLADNWVTLNKRYGPNKSFFEILKFQDVNNYTIISQREID